MPITYLFAHKVDCLNPFCRQKLYNSCVHVILIFSLHSALRCYRDINCIQGWIQSVSHTLGVTGFVYLGGSQNHPRGSQKRYRGGGQHSIFSKKTQGPSKRRFWGPWIFRGVPPTYQCQYQWSIISTICPRSLDPLHLASYYLKWVKTSWINSIISFINVIFSIFSIILLLQTTIIRTHQSSLHPLGLIAGSLIMLGRPVIQYTYRFIPPGVLVNVMPSWLSKYSVYISS